MIFFHKKILFSLMLTLASLIVIAQDKSAVPDLIKQGIQLNAKGIMRVQLINTHRL